MIVTLTKTYSGKGDYDLVEILSYKEEDILQVYSTIYENFSLDDKIAYLVAILIVKLLLAAFLFLLSPYLVLGAMLEVAPQSPEAELDQKLEYILRNKWWIHPQFLKKYSDSMVYVIAI